MFEKLMIVSSSHVTSNTAEWMDTKIGGMTLPGAPFKEEGWIVDLSELADKSDLPHCLAQLVDIARAGDASFLFLSESGSRLPELPVYTWGKNFP